MTRLDRYPEPRLYPRDVAERARCRQLEAAADEVLFPHIYELILEVFYKPAPERDADRIARAHAGIAPHYDDLERDLAGRDYLCGEFSVADIGYFMTVTFATNFGDTIRDEQPALRAWYDRVLARPSVTREEMGLAAAMERISS